MGAAGGTTTVKLSDTERWEVSVALILSDRVSIPDGTVPVRVPVPGPIFSQDGRAAPLLWVAV